MSRVPLYQLSAAHAALLEAAHEAVDDAELGVAIEALDASEMALAERVGGVAVALEAMAADIDRMRAEERRLAERRRLLEARVGRIRDHVAACLEAAGAKSVRTATHTISIGTGPETVEVFDAAAVPDACCVFERTPSKSAIMQEYRRTGIVPAGVAINAGRRVLRVK